MNCCFPFSSTVYRTTPLPPPEDEKTEDPQTDTTTETYQAQAPADPTWAPIPAWMSKD